MIWAVLCVELGVALTAGAVVMNVIMAGERMRAQAEKKALTLLRSWLSPEQAQQYDFQNHFEVVGSDTGTLYRIRHGHTMNIEQLDTAGNKVCKWCFLPKRNLATSDVMLAQKIALETFEIEALAIANRTSRQIEQPVGEPLSLLQWISRMAAPAIAYCLIAAIVLVIIITGTHSLIPASSLIPGTPLIPA
jgi:hypothetical protein